MSTFICLGVGTMLGDAFLHLIPMSLGLHAHDHGGHGDHSSHSKEEEEDANAFVWKMLVLLVAIYAFYLVESMFALVSRLFHGNSVDDDGSDGGHGHSHHFVPEAQSSTNQKAIDRKRGRADTNPTNIANHGSATGNVNFGYDKDEESIADSEKSNEESVGKVKELKTGICGIPTVVWLVLIGDGIHNFVDGIAIGAAFSASLRTGLSTSIAILLHELPHEFGDFAIFIGSGLSYRKALLLNLVSAATAFVGFFLGVQIAVDERVQLWVMAITAGMFIYVGLVDMLPEVMHNKEAKKLSGFLAQNLGIWVGVIIMILIALYEEQLHFE